jgi:putative SOS response-associated peptidase YedK
MDGRSRNLQLTTWGEAAADTTSGTTCLDASRLRSRSGAARWLPLWERWRDPANGETVKSFTIITGEPNALCAPIHNRMPVILDAADWQTWLGEVPARRDELQALLRPFPANLMEAHMIGPRIGNVKNDDATLIERLASA